MTSKDALNVRCWGKKLIFALKQICKMSWANLNLVTSDSNVMLGKHFFMAMMLSIKEFCLHFIFKLYWFYPKDWNPWYDLCAIKSLLFFTMLMVALTGHDYVYICLQILWSWLAKWIAPIFLISFTWEEMTFLISVLFYSCPPCGRVVRNLQNSDSQNSTDSQQASLCAQICHFLLFDY